MSLLSFTVIGNSRHTISLPSVKKARFVGSQASLWSSYATLKLQNVKSTTVVVKGANPSWEQDFLFELNNLDVGLLIEVWNKGRFWDNVIGYHYLYLTDIHCSNVAGVGQWLSLDAELVMRDGEVVGTKSPTGHVVLVTYANQLISPGDVEGDEAVELQWKLEMLNSMLDQEARAEQSRRQQQYYIQTGVSEDSDYTSDVNYPVGQHPNSSASQYLSAANYQISRSLNSTRENSYENDDEQQRKKGNVYPVSPRGSQPGRLLPIITPSMHSYDANDSRNYETDQLYYNSRPQQKIQHKSTLRTDSFDNGYGYSQAPEEDYHDAEEYHQPRRRPFRRKASSLERQDTLYADEDLEDYEPSKEYWNQKVRGYGVSTVPDVDQYAPLRHPHHRSTQDLPRDVYNSSQPEPFGGHSAQYNSGNYVDEKYGEPTPATDYVDNTRSIANLAVGTQDSYPYGDWCPTSTSRDHYAPPLPVTEYSQDYQQQHPLQNQPEKHTFQQQFGLTSLKKTIASVFPSISNISPSASSTTMLKTQNASIVQTQTMYAGTATSSQPYAYTETDQVVPQIPTVLDSTQFEEERFDFENWDFTNGYYDESGNFIPYQGYYDESGNFVPTESAPLPATDYFSGPSEMTGDLQSNYDSINYYESEIPESAGKDESIVEMHWQQQYNYDKALHLSYDEESYYQGQDDTQVTSDYTNANTDVHPQVHSRQPSIHSQSSVDYNYAYQSNADLTSSFDKPSRPESESSMHRANSIMRRRSFRRQTSTRDYALEGGTEKSESEMPIDAQPSSAKGKQQAFQQETMDSRFSMSIDDYGSAAWTSQEYLDAEGGTIGSNSYNQYENAMEDHPAPDDSTNVEGPVHMDSLESNTSEPGVRDRDANEKFEAQYWQRQRERIAEQATLCSQDSQEYYGTEYDSYEPGDNGQHPQRLDSIDESPFSPPVSSLSGTGGRRESESEWVSGGGRRSGRSSLDQQESWGSRHGSLTIKPKEVRRELSRQETMEGSIDVADQEYLDDYDDDETRHPFMRKHSIVSVDSLGETLPPTSPLPDLQKPASQQVSIDDDSVSDQRKGSLEVPGKDKGPKTVSFEEETSKATVPERLTAGMTSKEKWLWSMNRICSTLQVSCTNSYIYCLEKELIKIQFRLRADKK